MDQSNSRFLGPVFALLWLAWLAGGYFYASSKGPLQDTIKMLVDSESWLFYGWFLISTVLLFGAIIFLFRAFR
jgi:hypothetical protein